MQRFFVRSFSLVVVVVVVAGACASSENVEPPPQQVLAMAPIPFRAAELKAANPAGKRYRWRVEAQGQAVVYTEFVFDAADDNGATVTASERDASGTTTKTQTATTSWNALRMHAAFPADVTTVEDKEVTVPAGTYACKWYTVREDDGAVSHFCFVLAHPGPPVFFDRWRGEQQLMKSELVELAPGP